jgi:hypothetical protein
MSRHQKIDDTIQHLRNRYLKARLASLGAFKVGPVMSHICLRTQLATQFYPNPNTKDLPISQTLLNPGGGANYLTAT